MSRRKGGRDFDSVLLEKFHVPRWRMVQMSGVPVARKGVAIDFLGMGRN
jgi:hypothetical protein